MIIKSYGITDVGRIRTNNEDRFLICEDLNLFAVADGMGGHEFGEIASKIAFETIEGCIRNPALIADAKSEKITQDKGSITINRLIQCIREANNKIYNVSRQELRTSNGMGTTIVTVYIDDENVIIAHVGDSRAYRIRNGKIEQLTKDHSLVEEQIEKGILTKDEARTSNMKNVITRALGIYENVEVDVKKEVRKIGDIYLLCSDGLSDMIRDEEISQYIINSERNFEKVCKDLVELANERGGKDNITIVFVSLEDENSKTNL